MKVKSLPKNKKAKISLQARREHMLNMLVWEKKINSNKKLNLR
jgi:hypothetical protein